MMRPDVTSVPGQTAKCWGRDGFGCGKPVAYYSDEIRAHVCRECIGDEVDNAPESDIEDDR